MLRPNERQDEGSRKGYSVAEDGTITVHGVTLGPFAGAWQGRSRADIIAERLSAQGAAALANAELEIRGGDYVIKVGASQFQVTAADVGLNSNVIPSSTDRYKAVAAHYLTQLGAPVPAEPDKELNVERGEHAAKSARIEYKKGRAMYGAGRSWENWGKNKGELVNKYKVANRARAQDTYAWCGMFVGFHYKQVGIRAEILKNLVFWSGIRLEQFFSSGKYVATSKPRAGDWWAPHQTLKLGNASGEARKKKLDAFAPRPGDIALFRSDYSHVGLVTGYDPKTGAIDIIEGNAGNRVQATAYATGNRKITFIGRFNDADYEPGGDVDQALLAADDPEVQHGKPHTGSTR